MSTMTTEERCGMSDLLKSQCAHCRSPQSRPPRYLQAVFDPPWRCPGWANEDGNETSTRAEDRKHGITRQLAAMHRGRCAGCGNWFEIGDTIARKSGYYLCGGCVG
jgi:hypothetical protein